MHRTTIMLPPPLKRQAQQRADEMGVSLAELIRHALETSLKQPSRRRAAGVFDLPTFKGPKGVSRDVASALYGSRKR